MTMKNRVARNCGINCLRISSNTCRQFPLASQLAFGRAPQLIFVAPLGQPSAFHDLSKGVNDIIQCYFILNARFCFVQLPCLIFGVIDHKTLSDQ